MHEKNTGYYFRIIHRYLGFYLAGIMTVYSLSGIMMIYRNTDTFKKITQINVQLKSHLDQEMLGSVLKIKKFEVLKIDGNEMFFKDGSYNQITGKASYLKKELPYILDKMEHLHKATTDSPIYWLNIFFGVSLLFFVISAFWMFLPQTSVFKKGIYFSLAGIIMTIIILFI
jgi:hypothetical protein